MGKEQLHQVMLPDEQLLPVTTYEQGRFLAALAASSINRPVTFKDLAKRVKWSPQTNVDDLTGQLISQTQPLGWLIVRQDDSFYLKPTIRKDGFYPYVIVLESDERYAIKDGRDVKAISLMSKDRYAISIAEVLRAVFGRTSHMSGPTLLPKQVMEIVAEYNQDTPKNQWITPIVVNLPADYNRYLFPASQEDLALELLKQNKTRLEPLLPFEITPDEIKLLRERNQLMTQKIRQRLMWFALSLVKSSIKDVNEEKAIERVNSLIDSPIVWEKLLESIPPVNIRSGFQIMFRTAAYRIRLNDYRDQKKPIVKNQ